MYEYAEKLADDLARAHSRPVRLLFLGDSSALRQHAARLGAYVPVICLDDSYHEWMDDPPARGSAVTFCPPGAGGREWKNWESAKCVDWQRFLDRLQALRT